MTRWMNDCSVFTFCTRCTRISWVFLERIPWRMCNRSLVITFAVSLPLDQPDQHDEREHDDADDDREAGASRQRRDDHRDDHDDERRRRRTSAPPATTGCPSNTISSPGCSSMAATPLRGGASTPAVRSRPTPADTLPWGPAAARPHRSGVAHRQSIRLLIEGLWVRVPPPESHERPPSAGVARWGGAAAAPRGERRYVPGVPSGNRRRQLAAAHAPTEAID